MKVESDVHLRRRGRNFGVLAVLIGFIVVVFLITVVKVSEGGFSEGFDHVLRPQLIDGQTEEAGTGDGPAGGVQTEETDQ